MVHPVKDSIGSGRQIGTALPNPGKEIEEFFPILAHQKHLMGCISMEKEALAKQGEIPVEQEEDDYNHSANFYNTDANIRLGWKQFFTVGKMP